MAPLLGNSSLLPAIEAPPARGQGVTACSMGNSVTASGLRRLAILARLSRRSGGGTSQCDRSFLAGEAAQLRCGRSRSVGRGSLQDDRPSPRAKARLPRAAGRFHRSGRDPRGGGARRNGPAGGRRGPGAWPVRCHPPCGRLVLCSSAPRLPVGVTGEAPYPFGHGRPPIVVQA